MRAQQRAERRDIPKQFVTLRPDQVLTIEVLDSADPDHKRMLSFLPAELASRVVSVRRVRSLDRYRDFQLHQYEQSKQGDVHVSEPLFHGTPQRWRATAIATKGFDIRIRLHGRAFGSGVYAASHVNTAAAYSRSQGSILQLRGLVTSTTIVNRGTFVFPDPRALLPELIADFESDE